MKNTKRTIALGLAAAAVSTMVAVPTFATEGFGWGKQSGERPAQPQQEMLEHREAVDTAIENGDYEAWLEAVGERPVAEQVTADEFDQLREIHRLRTEARELMEQADEIAEEIGLKPPHRGHRMFKGMKQGFGAGHNCQAAQGN